MSATSTLTNSIAGRYSTALFELAKEGDLLEEVERDVDTLRTALAESADLNALFDSPFYSREQQGTAVKSLREPMGLGQTVGNLLELMAAKRRLFVLPAVLTQFAEKVAEDRGEMTADVTSARVLSDEQIEALKAQLRDAEGKDVKLNIFIDPSLIGGLIVRVGSRMIDTSIRSKLSRLQTAMREVG